MAASPQVVRVLKQNPRELPGVDSPKLTGQNFRDLRARFTQEPLEETAFTEAVLAAQRDWHRAALQGCRFAQHISTDYGRHGYSRLVVSGIPRRDSPVWDEVEQLEFENDVQACSVLIPDADTLEELVSILRGVGDREAWTLVEEDEGERRVFRLRLVLRSGVEAYVLGMAPFDCLPKTRQAPSLELAFRPKDKTGEPRSARLSWDRSTAHLADLAVRTLSDDAFERVFVNTVETKRRVNRGDDPLAKAKVTFAIPLGLVPR